MADDMRRPGESKADFQARMRAAFDASVAKGKAESEARDVSSLVAANAKAPTPAATPSLAAADPAPKRNMFDRRHAQFREAAGMADGGRVGREFPKKSSFGCGGKVK